MKKPAVIVSSFIVSAAIASMSGSGSTDDHQMVKNKVGIAAGTGVIGPAQANYLNRNLSKAIDRRDATVASMQPATGAPVQSGQAQQQATGPVGAQTSPTGAPAKAAPKPVAPPELRWRLEGTTLGGYHHPSALFVVEGMGEIIVHAGERITPTTRVMAIRNSQVLLLHDKTLSSVSPW